MIHRPISQMQTFYTLRFETNYQPNPIDLHRDFRFRELLRKYLLDFYPFLLKLFTLFSVDLNEIVQGLNVLYAIGWASQRVTDKSKNLWPKQW